MTEPSAVLRLTPPAALERAAECLRVLAHPHRLRIVQILLQGTRTVGELAEACGIAGPPASEHLRLMQRCGFLDHVKTGRRVYYRVAEPHLRDLLACIEARFGCAETVLGGPPETATDPAPSGSPS